LLSGIDLVRRSLIMGLMWKLSAFALLSCLCASAQTVEGTVIDSTYGNGIAGARVEIATAGAALIGEAAYTAVTDLKGRFRIDNVKVGVYVARYRAPGYLYEGDLTAGRPFQVVAGGNAVALEGCMIKMAEASGRVIDGRGDSVPNADMEATQIGRSTMGGTVRKLSVWCPDVPGSELSAPLVD
jgi:Carboxypeptidase regulatory-like domain